MSIVLQVVWISGWAVVPLLVELAVLWAVFGAHVTFESLRVMTGKKNRPMFIKVLRWIGVGSAVAAAVVAAAYLTDMDRAYARVEGTSTTISSPFGDIEYTERGSGVPVLVIHGSGGGYDQGELIAQAVLGDGFHWITPSRFGYLGSTFHEGATFDDQADAYAYLLDQLGVEKVAVVAMSHGGPSALLFAALYPERLSSLTLISCGVASSSDQNQAQANQKGDMLTTIFTMTREHILDHANE